MRRIIRFNKAPRVISAASVVGKKEKEGPLGACFDLFDPSDKFGKDTFEQAESEMQRLALTLAIKRSGLSGAPEAVFSGDLMNQCTSSSYGLMSFGAPYFGLYGACSTAAEGLILGAMSIESGAFETVGCVSSSHNGSAERQFRFPLEYGSQRPPTAQWTATASAAFILGVSEVTGNVERAVRVTEALPGRIVDKGICDQSNMGAAMAPAAANTLATYFALSRREPRDFDMILTGDLGKEGSSICRELLESEGIDMGDVYSDCGVLLYSGSTQDTHCGGSGCGCSAAVTAGYVLERFARGEVNDVLLVGTGALMSPTSVQQGLSIAGVAHLVHLSSD